MAPPLAAAAPPLASRGRVPKIWTTQSSPRKHGCRRTGSQSLACSRCFELSKNAKEAKKTKRKVFLSKAGIAGSSSDQLQQQQDWQGYFCKCSRSTWQPRGPLALAVVSITEDSRVGIGGCWQGYFCKSSRSRHGQQHQRLNATWQLRGPLSLPVCAITDGSRVGILDYWSEIGTNYQDSIRVTRKAATWQRRTKTRSTAAISTLHTSSSPSPFSLPPPPPPSPPPPPHCNHHNHHVQHNQHHSSRFCHQRKVRLWESPAAIYNQRRRVSTWSARATADEEEQASSSSSVGSMLAPEQEEEEEGEEEGEREGEGDGDERQSPALPRGSISSDSIEGQRRITRAPANYRNTPGSMSYHSNTPGKERRKAPKNGPPSNATSSNAMLSNATSSTATSPPSNATSSNNTTSPDTDALSDADAATSSTSFTPSSNATASPNATSSYDDEDHNDENDDDDDGDRDLRGDVGVVGGISFGEPSTLNSPLLPLLQPQPPPSPGPTQPTGRVVIGTAAVAITGLGIAGLIANQKIGSGDYSIFPIGPGDLIDWMEGRISEAGELAPLYFAIAYIACTVFFIPASVLTLAAGYLFGPLVGTGLVSISSTTGAATAFLISRYLARPVVRQALAKYEKFDAIDSAIANRGWRIVFLLRLSPLFPFALSNYGLGLTGIGFWQFIAASWVGMLPGTFAYVYLGGAGKAAVDAIATSTSAVGMIGLEGAAGGGGGGGEESSPIKLILYGVGAVATLLVTRTISQAASQAIDEASNSSSTDK